MRFMNGICCSAAVVLLSAGVVYAQGAPETARAIAGGGITVSGWQGKIDAGAEKQGQAVTYWNPKNVAKGDYTVSATFNEPKYMNLNSHPHPYGIVIGGNDLGTADQSYIYCAAYGSGMFIVRGFGPAPFQMNGREGEANAAIHKAAAVGEPVTQDIAMSVKGDKVTCSVNGTVVGTYDKSALVTTGKLKSTDG